MDTEQPRAVLGMLMDGRTVEVMASDTGLGLKMRWIYPEQEDACFLTQRRPQREPTTPSSTSSDSSGATWIEDDEYAQTSPTAPSGRRFHPRHCFDHIPPLPALLADYGSSSSSTSSPGGSITTTTSSDSSGSFESIAFSSFRSEVSADFDAVPDTFYLPWSYLEGGSVRDTDADSGYMPDFSPSAGEEGYHSEDEVRTLCGVGVGGKIGHSWTRLDSDGVDGESDRDSVQTMDCADDLIPRREKREFPLKYVRSRMVRREETQLTLDVADY